MPPRGGGDVGAERLSPKKVPSYRFEIKAKTTGKDTGIYRGGVISRKKGGRFHTPKEGDFTRARGGDFTWITFVNP